MSISIGYLQLCLLVLQTLNPAQGVEIGHPSHLPNVPEGSSMRMSPCRKIQSTNTNDSMNMGNEVGNEMIEQNPDQNIVEQIQEKASGITLSKKKKIKYLLCDIHRKITCHKSNTEIAKSTLEELAFSWYTVRSVYHENHHLDALNLKATRLFEELEVFQAILFNQVKNRFLPLGVKEQSMKGFGPSSIDNQTKTIRGIKKVLSFSELGSSQETFFQELMNLFQRIDFKEIEESRHYVTERKLFFKLQVEIFEILKYMVTYKLTTRETITELFKDDKTLFLSVLNACSQEFEPELMSESSSLMLENIFTQFTTLDIVDIGILNASQKRKIMYFFFKAQWLAFPQTYGDTGHFSLGIPRKMWNGISNVLKKSFDNDKLLNTLEDFKTVFYPTSPKHSGFVPEKPESAHISGGSYDQIDSLGIPQLSSVIPLYNDISNISSKLETKTTDTISPCSSNSAIKKFFASLKAWVDENYGRP